jgi:hypothetical protein
MPPSDVCRQSCLVARAHDLPRSRDLPQWKVELVEALAEAEGSRVIVIWVHPAEPVDLCERGIDESQAADLRRRLAPFAEDWDRPEMAAYDELPPR